MSTKIYVGGLNEETTETQLQEFFKKHGTILSVTINSAGKHPKGSGLVEMERAEEAQKAITILHGKELGGKKLVINQARPQQDKNLRPGFHPTY